MRIHIAITLLLEIDYGYRLYLINELRIKI
jgi:hypothetical protein